LVKKKLLGFGYKSLENVVLGNVCVYVVLINKNKNKKKSMYMPQALINKLASVIKECILQNVIIS
jgi:hypothetical protein